MTEREPMSKLYKSRTSRDFRVEAMVVGDDPTEISKWMYKRNFRYLYRAHKGYEREFLFDEPRRGTTQYGFFFLKGDPGVYIRNRGDDTYVEPGSYIYHDLTPRGPVLGALPEVFHRKFKEVE